MSAAKEALPTRVEEILTYCRDPIELRLFTDADVLFPCGHSIVHSFTTTFFGALVNNQCTQLKPCPICRSVVTAYVPNYQLRELVNKVLEIASHTPYELDALPRYPIVVQEKEENLAMLMAEQNVPYPGKPGKFQVFEDCFDGSAGISRISFLTTTHDSLIHDFQISSIFSRNNIYIDVNCPNAGFDAVIEKYLNSCGFTTRCIHSTIWMNKGHFSTRDTRVSKRLFAIIAKNNELPEEQFQKIVAIFKDERYYRAR